MMVVLGLVSGCTNLDPWGVFDAVPESPRDDFGGGASSSTEHLEDRAARRAREISGQTLDFSGCVQIALEHNPRTADSWQAIRAAAATVGQAKAEYLPSIGLKSNIARGDAADLDGRSDTANRDRVEAMFGLQWLLFDGGGRRARVDAAGAEVLKAGFAHNSELQAVTLAVVTAYHEYLAAMSTGQLAEQTVRQRDYQRRLAEALHRAGMAPRSDILRARAEHADAVMERIEARNAIHAARGRLAHAMGLPAHTSFQIARPEPVNHEQQLADIEQLLEEAVANRPELKAAKARLEREHAGVRLAASRYWPAVSFDTAAGLASRNLPPDQSQWTLGFGVDLPLFTGFERTYSYQKSETAFDRARAGYQRILRDVELEVWIAYWQIIESTEAIEAAEYLVASAHQSARAAEGEYRHGVGTILGVIEAQTTLTGASNRLIQAQLNWRLAKLQFDHALGRSLLSRTLPGEGAD